MPWYEPSNRPPSAGKLVPSRLNDEPPNPHHRACDEALARHPDDDEVDISPYIDERWSYPKRDAPENQNCNEINGDRLQFRVEQHLSNMFPSLGGCFSRRTFDHGSDRFHFGGDNFFSPLVAADNVDSEDVTLYSQNDGSFKANRTYASNRHDANIGHGDDNDYNTSTATKGGNNSMTQQNPPRDLFQVKENAQPVTTAASPFINLFNSAKRTPPVQSTLTQNAKTGKLGISSFVATPTKKKTRTWDDIGNGKARAVVRASYTMEDTDKVTKQLKGAASKKARKQNDRTSNANKGQSEVENLLESMHTSSKDKASKKRESDPNDRARTKKTKQTSLDDAATFQQEEVPIKNNTRIATISIEDFDGLEKTGILNAGSNMQSLHQFLGVIGQKKHATWTMLFLDEYYSSNAKSRKNKKKKSSVQKSGKFDLPQQHQGYQITTPFLPTSKKYCTEKGPPCSSWNCTCDSQIRAKRSMAPLLGAMFLVRDEQSDSTECYILPLGPINETTNDGSNQSPIYSRMENWPSIPFDCEVPLKYRWAAFKAILSRKIFKLVTYNATVSLLPLYHHLIHDGKDRSKVDTHREQFNECIAYLSADDKMTTYDPLAPDECLYSIWDIRLVAWMLRPNATDSELEFSCIKEGFAHFVDPPDQHNGEMRAMAHGLLEAKNNLLLLSKVYPIMNEQLIRNDLLPALERIEAPVQSILAAMECRGIAFYPKRLQSAQSQIEMSIHQLEEKARVITKDSNFLLSSPQQCSKFIFDVLKLSMPDGLVSKTKAGSNHRSTSEEALKSIKAAMISTDGKCHPFIDIVLEFRHFNKVLSTYILPLPMFSYKEHHNDQFPKIHPQWMQTAARTGRLSCRKPNLQQVPKSSQVVDPRKAFVPSGGKKENVLFACDYSQKEVRILAHMCQDKALISLFTGDQNVDIYKQMASLIRNKPIASVTSDERAQFKQVTLAILYGMSPKQVAKKLNISEEAAKRTMIDFFRKFSTLKRWMDETIAFAREHHYVKTIAGRKRYLDNINSDDRALKGQAERQAINTVIQGSAADMMKTAMLNMAENLRQWKGPVKERPKMLLQIHDELVLEVCFDETHIYWLKEIAIKSCCHDCEKCFRLTVPLILDCTCGLSWQSMKPLGDAKG